MMKKSLIIFSFLILLITSFIGFVSAEDQAQITEEEAEKEATYDLEKSADLSQFYTRGRFLLGILSFFKGGTCGDGICSQYKFSCFEDCGKLVAKNNWINGDVYSGESNYDEIKYQFQVTGKCEGLGSTLKEKDTEGAVIKDMEVAVRYAENEEVFQVGDKEDFTLKNGKTFYVNSQMCELLGFVDIALTNPVCGDGACWRDSERECPQDCGFFWVGFQQDDTQTPIKLEYIDNDGYNQSFYSGFYKDDTHTPIKTKFEYNGYHYSFEFTAVQKVRHLIFEEGKNSGKILNAEELGAAVMFANLSVTYFPVNNPSLKVVKDITLIGSPITDFSLNGLNFRVSLPLWDNKAVKLKLKDNFHVATFQFME
jgi:hypothetical protein